MSNINLKGSSWMKKTLTRRGVFILKVLVYITLIVGNYHMYQTCPC